MSANALSRRATSELPSPAAVRSGVVPPGGSLQVAYDAAPGPAKALELLGGEYGEGETLIVRNGESLALSGTAGLLTELRGTIIVFPEGALYLEGLTVVRPQTRPAAYGPGYIHSRSIRYVATIPGPPILAPSGPIFFEDVEFVTAHEGELGLFAPSATHVEIRGTLRFENPSPIRVAIFGANTTVQGETGAIESAGGGIRIVGPHREDGQEIKFRLGSLRLGTDAPVDTLPANATSLSAVAFVGLNPVLAEGDGAYSLEISSVEVDISANVDGIAGAGAHIIAATDQEGNVMDDLTQAGVHLRIGQLVVNDRQEGGGNSWTKVKTFAVPSLADIAADPLNT